MVRGKDPIRHHVRRQIRHGVMVNRPRHKIPDTPVESEFVRLSLIDRVLFPLLSH
jgi:hypothetical protein